MSARPYRLCIDPGHGGPRPGPHGWGAVNKELDIKEKHINLKVGLLMKDYIVRGDYLCDVCLTREKDEFTSLPSRCHLASSWKADGFMSIHCNSREMKGRYGLEIEVFHYPKSKKGREFANITLDMLLKNIAKTFKVINRGVKEGKYYVLKHTKMPAILVELGFLRDNEEALFLSAIDNQEKIATCLCEAAELYLEGGSHEWSIGEKLE